MRSPTRIQLLVSGGIALLLAAAWPRETRGDDQERPFPSQPRQQPDETPRPDRPEGEPSPRIQAPADPPRVEYRPPRRGAPRIRVAGAVRGASRALPRPLALVPDHVGETISVQPSLFWHIDARPAPRHELVFTLTAAHRIEPLIETRLAAPVEPGIQRIRLEDHGVRLRPGVEYEWSIALVAASERGSEDLVSSGSIRLVTAPDALDPSVAGFAAQGLWYDALESASDEIEADPANRELLGRRDALLRQASLDPAID